MIVIRPNKPRLLLAIATFALLTIVINYLLLSETDIKAQIENISLPAIPGLKKEPWHTGENIDDSPEAADDHPISQLMKSADKTWRAYEDSRSRTFRQTVKKYRRKYGRHPPPRFGDWYQFARGKGVHNIDDFEQIMDDIRPFWAIEPRMLRNLAANMWREGGDASVIHIRNKKVEKVNNPTWRSDILVTLIEKFVEHMPDMDIAMNTLDQPRVVVPWDDMQKHLAQELETRQTRPEVEDAFTSDMQELFNVTSDDDSKPREDAQWYPAPGKQYMDIAKTACPPESHARNNWSTPVESEKLYKEKLGGVVTNFNRSSDLCTVGPEIKDMHGFLFASSSLVATKRLVPVFGECKVNVNSDILFPANMYYKQDDRYEYSSRNDKSWGKKRDLLIWRGVSSGGTQDADNWQKMQRQRFVMLVNSTHMEEERARILIERLEAKDEYETFRGFDPAEFAANYTDVGFTGVRSCIPDDCPFYSDVWTIKGEIPLSEHFESKYLVDVDGHSFSGRWRAFLWSKSLGIKATIFREWHDSRLFAWRHFVPMDNRFDDLYTILTYFIGLGDHPPDGDPSTSSSTSRLFVARHDGEAKRIANQGSEWAKKVLRREDIEVN